jgi:hypothetical protein
MTPALWWPERSFGGNKQALLRANRANLERAIQRFGSVGLIHAHVSYPAGWLALRLARDRHPYVVTEHRGPFPVSCLRLARPHAQAHPARSRRARGARLAVSPMLARPSPASASPSSSSSST